THGLPIALEPKHSNSRGTRIQFSVAETGTVANYRDMLHNIRSGRRHPCLQNSQCERMRFIRYRGGTCTMCLCGQRCLRSGHSQADLMIHIPFECIIMRDHKKLIEVPDLADLHREIFSALSVEVCCRLVKKRDPYIG